MRTKFPLFLFILAFVLLAGCKTEPKDEPAEVEIVKVEAPDVVPAVDVEPVAEPVAGAEVPAVPSASTNGDDLIYDAAATMAATPPPGIITP